MEATFSTRNRIVIPRAAREALCAKRGDKRIVIVRGDRVIVLRQPKSYHAALRGLGRGVSSGAHLRKERQSWD